MRKGVSPQTLLTICFVLIAIFVSSTLVAKIICDKFKIVANITGSVLNLSVDTDLPDNTEIMVEVSRSYFRKGDREEYSIEYFSEKGTVGKWKSKHDIPLDETKWKAAMKEEQKKMAMLGRGFDIASISNKITSSMVVPYNQQNPIFGKENSNLTGKAITVREGGYRVVEGKVETKYPLKSMPASKSSFHNVQKGDPFNLKIGTTYALTRKTPYLPPNSPSDPFEAMKHLRQIPPGGAIKVLGKIKGVGNPTYQIIAFDSNGQQIGGGTVISNALVGQELKVHK